MDDLIHMTIQIDDGFSMILFVMLQLFMAWSTFQFWRIRTLQIKHSVNVIVANEGEASDGL